MSEGNFVQPVGNEKRHNQTDGNADSRVFNGIPQNQPEILIAQNLLVVAKTNEFFGAQQVPFQGRYIKCLKGRIEPDRRIKHNRNQQK